MLLLAATFWGISNSLTAVCLEEVQPLTLNAFRFIVGFLVLGSIYFKRLRGINRKTIKYSVLVGLSLVVVYAAATYGVMYTSVSNAGFIGAMTVLFTPLFEFVLYRKKPGKKFSFAIVLCTIGIAMLTLNETLKPAPGDIICLLVPSFYAVDLMLTEKAVADPEVDGLALGVCDLAVVGGVMLVLSFLVETPALPRSPKVWASALFLGIFCSGVCLVLQSVYQKDTTAVRAGLIFTLEPLFSAAFAFFLLGERLGPKGYIGAALMLVSLVVMEIDIPFFDKTE